MKRIKKCLMVILALCLIATSAVNCFAFDSANEVLGATVFSATQPSANAGDTVDITINVGHNQEKAVDGMYILAVDYDKASLEYVGANADTALVNASIMKPSDAYDKDKMTLTLGYTDPPVPEGELITYKFKIKPEFKGKSIDVGFECLSTASRKQETWTYITSKITVSCAHTSKTAVAAVPATCASVGTKAHEKCADCGKLFLNGKEVTEAEVSTPKDPTNHDGETEIRNAKPATEEAEGYTGDTYCLGCNQKIKDGEKIPKLDHAHAMTHTDATAPTCTDDGVVEHWTCSKCGNSYADEAGTVKLESTVDPKLGHKTELKDAKEATCTEDGYTGDEICTVCNETVKKGETVVAKGHTVEKVDEKEATCSEDGYTGDEVCTVCNEIIKKGEVISKNDNHDYQWVVDKEPTFEETGLKHEECTRCHDKRSLDTVIEKNDCFHGTMEHHEKVAATCIATGTCEYWHCTECDRNYSDEKGTLKIEKAEDLVLPIDPNNHVNTEIRDIKSATCSAEGYTGDKYCTDCNTLIASGSTLAINPDGHNYINNKCEYCGKIQVTYYPPTFTYIDDETHLAGGNIRSHVPDSMTMHTDGVYEWNYCLYCQHEYGRVPVAEVDINIDDSVDLVADDPVQSTDDGDDIDVDDNTGDNTGVDVTEPEDNNPSTGMAIALLPMALAAAAASLVRKK